MEEKPKDWKKVADRENKRRANKVEKENQRRVDEAPLLASAGLVPLQAPPTLTDADQMKARSQRIKTNWIEQAREAERAALEVSRIYRCFLAWILTVDDLDYLDWFWEDRLRRGFPETHEYRADYWYQTIKKIEPSLLPEIEEFIKTQKIRG